MHNTAFIALGSNLPFAGIESPQLLACAVSELQAAGLEVGARSGIWRTAAWPPSDLPDYFNAVVAIDAGSCSPQELYAMLRAIEARYGRERREKWAARTLDLDIVAMDDFVGTFGGIVLPHPYMHERGFVLAPMAEIAPNWRHPIIGRTVSTFVSGISDISFTRVGDLPV